MKERSKNLIIILTKINYNKNKRKNNLIKMFINNFKIKYKIHYYKKIKQSYIFLINLILIIILYKIKIKLKIMKKQMNKIKK